MHRSAALLVLAALTAVACVQPSAPSQLPVGISAEPAPAESLPVSASANTPLPSPEALTQAQEAAPDPTPAPEPAPVPAPVTAPEPAPAPAPPKPAHPANAKTTAGEAWMAETLASGGAALKSVLAAPEQYRFQVLYGEIVTKNGKPALERRSYRADAEYFFPASSMKMPIALAAYDRLAALRSSGKPHLTPDATLRIHPVSGNGEPVVTTLARETRRALIVSDNFSANRLLALVGHRELHKTLWGLGLGSARVHTGFATGAELDPAEVSPDIDVVLSDGAVERLAARRSTLDLPATDATGLDIGTAKIVDGRRVDGPLSFADKNAMKLRELQDTLVHIMRPDLLPSIATKSAGKPHPANARGGNPATDTASREDLELLRQTLGTLPSESGIAGYDRNIVADYQLSPFLRGIERVRPRGRFQIYSKVGQAYGFLIHNAYVIDKDTGRAFFLIASIFSDPDGTMNDDRYGYDTISFPALADVGEVFARHAFGQ
jgi:Beta-lactamase enzyme family